MKPLVIILPLALVMGGIAQFFLLTMLPVYVRVLIMLAEFVAAAVVGYVLWRRSA